MGITPAQERERIRSRKLIGKSTLDWEFEYESKLKESEKIYKDSKIVSKQINQKVNCKRYSSIMDMENYYSINGTESLVEKFIGLMKFYEEINPNWKKSYNNKEGEKASYKSAPLPENYIMQDFISEALNSEVGAFGSITEENMKRIRINALTMFYSNKIAHYAKYLRERYLYHILNYGIIGNDSLDQQLEWGNHKRVYAEIKEYCVDLMDYYRAKGDEEEQKRCKNKVKRRKEALKKYGISENKKIVSNEILLNLVMLERDAYAIKDVMISNLVDELRNQNDISYGTMIDEQNREVLVIDLPYYGQFSVHTKRETSLKEEESPRYKYDVYGIEEGNILLTQARTETMGYILKTWKKKNKREIEDVLDVADVDEMEDIHNAAVKLGLKAAEISKVYELSKSQDDIDI